MGSTSKSMRRRTVIVVTVISIAVLAFYQVALALDGAQGPPLPAVQSKLVGSESSGVQVIRQFTPSKTNSTAFVPLMTGDVVLDQFEQALVVFTLSGESACFSTSPDYTKPGWCRVRILLNGLQTEPNDSGRHNAAFDSTDASHALVPHDDQSEGPDSYESHALQRSMCVTNIQEAPVAIGFRVVWATTNANIDFWLDDIHLTVEKFASNNDCKTRGT